MENTKEEMVVINCIFEKLDGLPELKSFGRAELIEKLKKILIKNNKIETTQKIQSLIIKEKELRVILPLIVNITGQTIIEYCETNKKIPDISLNILFDIYKKAIKPRIEEFKSTEYLKNKKLKIALLSVIRLEKLMELLDPEAIKLYNDIKEGKPKLNNRDYKKIVSKNPQFIGFIENQTEELQLAAIKSDTWDGDAIAALNIKHICDKGLAILLTEFPVNHQFFKGAFEEGVPNNIIDLIIEIEPEYVFNGILEGKFKKEVTSAQKNRALEISPNLFRMISKGDVTTELVIKAVDEGPRNLGRVGTEHGIYTRLLAERAKAHLPNFTREYQRGALKIIKEYEQVLYDRDHTEVIYDKAIYDRDHTEAIYMNKLKH